ncbi:hypothetical protein F2Q69_00035144 [Brassica cretica]|uniref:Uncharacterized protein n=1 Tax=Brassica cretica TaxID=69181 RepID=A0A8S9SBR7_BRACR|nr:hypothetical protein F2Q69_00035144 [Brassica cretica]
MPKIDVARLNALRPKPKPSENPPEAVRTPSDDGIDSMEVDKAPTGRTLRKRKENVVKHLKRGDNENEKEKTKETEEDIRRMFCEAREQMRKRVTLKKKSDPGQFAIPCTVKGIEFLHALCDTGASVSILPRIMADHMGLQVEPSKELFTFVDCSHRNSGGIVRDLEVQIGNALVPVEFHVLDIKLNRNSSLLLDHHVHYNPIPVKKPQTTPRRINDPGIIAVCHCGAEYETEYLASIETHTASSIDNAHQISTDTPKEESVDSSPEEWENDSYSPIMATHNMHTEEYDEDYEEERAIEQRANLDEEIDFSIIPLGKRTSTDIDYYPSIDTNVDATRDRDYSIGSWADDRHHESYAVETAYHDQGADELHEDFTYEELLNNQRCDETDQKRAEAAWGRTHFIHPIDRAIPPSIDIHPSTSININNTTSIDNHPKPKIIVSEKDKSDNQYLTPDEFGIFRDSYGYEKAIDGRTLHVSREDITDILQIANGADNFFMQQHTITEHQQKVTKEFYDTAGGLDKRFKQSPRHLTRPSIDVDVPTSVDRHPEFGRRAFDLSGTRKFYWEEKDAYGIYGDDQGYARDVDEHTIRVHNKDIRRLLEEINEMFYGICGEQEKNKEYFQMKLDGVYYPLNDSISWLTTCMEEMRQDIARIQRANDISRSTSIDRHRQASIDSRLHASIDNRLPASVDDNPPHSHTMKSQPDFHTRGEIDQLVEGICRALETTEERLDRRCDDIYFPMDLRICALTSKIEAIQGRNNKSTNIHRQTSVDDAINRGRLVHKVTSDMYNTYNREEEISADIYATVMRHQFNLESLGDRLQKIEDATTIMKNKWRRGYEAMRDFTGTWFNKRREEMETCFPTSANFQHY